MLQMHLEESSLTYAQFICRKNAFINAKKESE